MTAKPEIKIRQATPEDEPALQKFYHAAYDNARYLYKYPFRWNWLYRENPFIPKGFGLPIWVAIRRDEIVGHTGAMFVPCMIKEKRLIAAWSVDTIILPPYRGTSLGKRLQKANQDAHEMFMSLSMSPANRAIKKKLGAVPGPAAELNVHTVRIDRNALFKGTKSQLQNRLGDSWGKKVWQLFCATGVPWLFTKYLEARLLNRQKTQISHVQEKSLDFKRIKDRFGDEADQFWDSCRGSFNFSVERTSTYLNWKYGDQPHIRYERFYAYNGNQLAGLIIFRLCEPPEPKLGVISEIICAYENEKLLIDMIYFATERLYRHNGLLGIYTASALPAHQKVLKKLGFLSLSSEEICLFDRSQQPDTSNRPWLALVAKGDHDWDQHPTTRQISISEIRQIFKNWKAGIS